MLQLSSHNSDDYHIIRTVTTSTAELAVEGVKMHGDKMFKAPYVQTDHEKYEHIYLIIHVTLQLATGWLSKFNVPLDTV